MAGMTVRAIVLRGADYKDYDRILTLFAYGKGAITAAARFCRRIKSPLLNTATPFVAGEFVLSERVGRYTVKSCAVEDSHYALREDPLRLACASYLCVLCEEAVQPDQPDDLLFELLLRALAFLCYGDAPPLSTTLCFLLRFLDQQGVGPILTRCSRCGGALSHAAFDPRGAGALCHACSFGASAADPMVLFRADALRRGPFEPPMDADEAAFERIAAYASAHFERSKKSLLFLKRMMALG